MPKEKHQTSLDSFFGGGKPVKKQKRLDSFFGKNKSGSKTKESEKEKEDKNDVLASPTNTVSTSNSTPDAGKKSSKQKRLRDCEEDTTTIKDSMEIEEKENENKKNNDNKKKKKNASPKEKKQRTNTNKARRVIDDDDSTDDEGDNNKANDNDDKDNETNDKDKDGDTAMDDEILNGLQEEAKAKVEKVKETKPDGKESENKSTTGVSKKKTGNIKDQKDKSNKISSKDEDKKVCQDEEIKDKEEDDDGEDSNPASLSSSSSMLSLVEQKKLPISEIQKALKGQIKTDLQLLKQDEHLKQVLKDAAVAASTAKKDEKNKNHLLPYSLLCTAFEKIEAITARLQIQEIFTTLLRTIILRSYAYSSFAVTEKTNSDAKNNNNSIHQDLYSVLYLASNTVAPAYKCIELGIGDAILIKAIAEAYGSSIKFVKQKYETDGDLGTAAMSFKNKQKTLGGFFAKPAGSATTTAKKVGLTCQEVITTFREIASIKGKDSQELKRNKIKKLLVRASSPQETKYIIRGLQGKLRIGLAQSTVLISLGHALAITLPPQTIMNQKEDDTKKNQDDAEEEVPEEVVSYRNKKIPIEKRLEAVVSIIKKAYCEVPSYDILLDTAYTKGVALHDIYKVCTLTPGIPVTPMLAKPTKSIQEVLKRLNGLQFTCEYKYDGERAQVHMFQEEKDGKTKTVTKVFSRNLLDTSEKYPEVPLFVQEAIVSNNDDNNSKKEDSAVERVTSFVMDAEVVAYNNETERLVPFQVLSTRKQKEESAETAKVQVIVQAFDLMYLNGKSLLNRSLKERRSLLYKHFKVVPGKFQYAVAIDYPPDDNDEATERKADEDDKDDDDDKEKEKDTAYDIEDTSAIEEFLDKAIKGQCEGLMIKTLNTSASIYEPSRRSLNWLKLKKDYLEGSLGDSIDLVPIGAFFGKGKRTGVYGAYLLACYDVETEQYQSVCKIGTGFSEQDLQTLADQLNEHIIPKKSSQYNVSDAMKCDVWFDTATVWEIKAADLSTSSMHRGAEGKVKDDGSTGSGDRRGIGLRFPRFERIRKDKKPEEATSSDQILEMYYKQDTIDNNADDDDDDDLGI